MKKLLFAAVLLLFAGFTFAQTLQSGGVVMIHELKHSMDDEALKGFMNDWAETITPLYMENFPDVKMTAWIKGVGADNMGSLAVMVYYESLEDYRLYFKEDATTTEKGTAAYAAVMPAFMSLIEKYGEITWVVGDWYIIP